MDLGIAFLMMAAAAAPGEKAGTARSRDGLAVHYRARGDGEPAVVFVHGWGIDGKYWDEAMAALAKSRRVVALDLAGHGKSGANRADWTMAAFAEDVRAVVEALRLRRVVLVGHSMSGNVILEAARLMPDRVVGLVPVDTLLDPDWRASETELADLLGKFRADYAGTTRGFADGYLFVEKTPPAVRERVLNDMISRGAAMGLAVLESSWRYDPRPGLSAVKVPIVAVNADKFPTRMDALRRLAPQFEVLYVPGVGHYPMLEAPAEFAAQLARAIDKIETARPARP